MALDYDLEIEKYGTQDKLTKLRDLIQSEFMLTDHKETKIMTAPGIGISFFVDDIESDNELHSPMISNLIVGFRIDKFQLQKQGYKLLLRVVQKILDTVEVDLRLVDESDEHILLQRKLGKTTLMDLEHDIWKAGTLDG